MPPEVSMTNLSGDQGDTCGAVWSKQLSFHKAKGEAQACVDSARGEPERHSPPRESRGEVAEKGVLVVKEESDVRDPTATDVASRGVLDVGHEPAQGSPRHGPDAKPATDPLASKGPSIAADDDRQPSSGVRNRRRSDRSIMICADIADVDCDGILTSEPARSSLYSALQQANQLQSPASRRPTFEYLAGAPITPLHHIPYVHCGYANAAPLFVTHPKFASILKTLLPGAYAELSFLLRQGKQMQFRRSDYSDQLSSVASCSSANDLVASDTVSLPDPVKIMKWAENNPVVSAFGIMNSDSGRGNEGALLDRIYSSADSEDCQLNRLNTFDSYHTISAQQRMKAIRSPATSSIRTGGLGDHAPRQIMNSPYQSMRRKCPTLPEDTAFSASVRHPTDFIRTINGDAPKYKKPALEWDVFLDPKLVRQVDQAMTVVDDLERKLKQLRNKRNFKLSIKNIITNDSDVNENEEDDLLEAHTAAQVEVDRLVSHLMKRTILAHGSMSQLILEAVGVAPVYNFGTVVKSSRENPNEKGTQELNNVPLIWDEDQQQRDFESLLDATIIDSGGVRMKKPSRGNPAPGSKGMFMETWLSIFAQTLNFLESTMSTTRHPRRGDLSSSLSGRRKRNDHAQEKLWLKTSPAQIGQRRGLGSFLDKMFFLRRDSSFPDAITKGLKSSDDDFESHEDEIDSSESDSDDSEEANVGQLITLRKQQNSMNNHDMFASSPSASSSSSSLCGLLLCLGMADSTPSFPLDRHASHKMAQDIQLISDILGEPLRLVLDLKSRRVPPRVWSRLIDNLRSRGLVIEGIGSFDMDEARVIGKGCSYPLTPILFFHSVGDLQRACHANEVKNGDTVYFNAGSLIWKRPSIIESAERGCCGVEGDADALDCTDASTVKSSSKTGCAYSFQPYSYPRSVLSDWEKEMCKATIEDYQRHFNLKIGVYVQGENMFTFVYTNPLIFYASANGHDFSFSDTRAEFSISAEALDVLSLFVNEYSSIYNQGLAFGGINGMGIKNVHGDGYWNQRFMGRSWDFAARPSNAMTPLKPEDHHMVQKAIQAGAWGQVGTIYEVMDEQTGAMTVPGAGEPCSQIQIG